MFVLYRPRFMSGVRDLTQLLLVKWEITLFQLNFSGTHFTERKRVSAPACCQSTLAGYLHSKWCVRLSAERCIHLRSVSAQAGSHPSGASCVLAITRDGLRASITRERSVSRSGFRVIGPISCKKYLNSTRIGLRTSENSSRPGQERTGRGI